MQLSATSLPVLASGHLAVVVAGRYPALPADSYDFVLPIQLLSCIHRKKEHHQDMAA